MRDRYTSLIIRLLLQIHASGNALATTMETLKIKYLDSSLRIYTSHLSSRHVNLKRSRGTEAHAVRYAFPTKPELIKDLQLFGFSLPNSGNVDNFQSISYNGMYLGYIASSGAK